MNVQIASGSQAGIAHMNGGRNNQDAFVTKLFPAGFVGVICDGCSEGSHSEVGAWLAAEMTASAVVTQVGRAFSSGASELPEQFWRRILDDVLAQLRVQALTMAGTGSMTEVVMNYFLFTLVGVIVTQKQTWIFSVGDGVYAINGETFELPRYEENEPPYPAFQLIGSKFDSTPELLRIRVQLELPTSEVDTLLIGSDGLSELRGHQNSTLPGRRELVGPLSQFWENDRFFKLGVAVRQRLALVNTPVFSAKSGELRAYPGLVKDDMTLVALRIRKHDAHRTGGLSWMQSLFAGNATN